MWMGSLPCCSGLCRDTGPENSDAVTRNQEACTCQSRFEAAPSYMKFMTLQSFNSLCMCCIVMDCSIRARAPESVVFYRFVFFWNFSPLLLYVFIKVYTCCKVERENKKNRAGLHEKYLKNGLSKSFGPQCLHPGSILGCHAQSITPAYSPGDQMLLKMWWN